MALCAWPGLLCLLGMMSMDSASTALDIQPDGIVLSLPQPSASGVRRLKIQVCTDRIVRILASPDTTFSSRPSLMVQHGPWAVAPWSVKETGTAVELSTPRLTVRVQPGTGELAFFDAAMHPLLQAPPGGGTSIIRATVMGERTYHIRQTFDSPDTEAFYGLGGHQNAIMNYRGHDVDLWQHNMVTSVPFLVSSRNYGILWDNTSRTKFGDIREYESMAPLRLFGSNGKEGGLTAEYFRDARWTSLFASRTDSLIEHQFIDVHDAFPAGFDTAVTAVRWSGSILCREPGLHKFRLYSSGTTRVWINDSLVVDSWRQNWNPWTNVFTLSMEQGRHYSLRIEWLHGGGYIGLQCLGPDPREESPRLSLYSEVADQIDYYVIAGTNADEVIGGYRTLTGRAPLLPLWAYGFWQSREHYNSQEEILSTVREFRNRRIPLDNIVQDWFYWKENAWGEQEFDLARYPDPSAMTATLHDSLHAQIMISVWPKFYEETKAFKEFDRHGWLYRRNVEVRQKDWVGPGYVSTFYDPYNDSARAAFWSLVEARLFRKGIDAWWLDCTEPDIQSNLSHNETILRQGPTALGTAARYLNAYALMHARGVYEGQRQAETSQRVFILTRSAFAGMQRYATTTWSGDLASTWYDFKAQISSGCNFCMAGLPYWTMDIGGFSVETRFEHPTDADREEWRELQTRWFQFGAFCPIFRSHGQFPYREPYAIAPPDHPAYQSMLTYDRLRYRLMPYIYSLAGMVTHANSTIMRALVMDFGSDARALGINDQFMFGPSLLVNPVTTYKARARQVYLPRPADWYDFLTGQHFHGGQEIQVNAPYAQIPVFVKAGSILPVGPEMQYTGERRPDPIRLYVYTGAHGTFPLYEDEGTNYNYEHGVCATIPLTYDENRHTLTIGKRQGSFPGMLANRTFEIVWITPRHPRPLDFPAPADMLVRYRGDSLTIACPSDF